MGLTVKYALVQLHGFCLVFSALICIIGCESIIDCPDLQFPPGNADRVTISQGIWGDIWLWEGDFMPSCPEGTITAVERDIFVHEATSIADDCEPPRGTFYTSVNSNLISEVHSDDSGFYQVELPPGRYSIVTHYTLDDTLFYANWFDGVGYVSPVEVEEGKVTEFHIDLYFGGI